MATKTKVCSQCGGSGIEHYIDIVAKAKAEDERLAVAGAPYPERLAALDRHWTSAAVSTLPEYRMQAPDIQRLVCALLKEMENQGTSGIHLTWWHRRCQKAIEDGNERKGTRQEKNR